jgi:hypothetical protein
MNEEWTPPAAGSVCSTVTISVLQHLVDQQKVAQVESTFGRNFDFLLIDLLLFLHIKINILSNSSFPKFVWMLIFLIRNNKRSKYNWSNDIWSNNIWSNISTKCCFLSIRFNILSNDIWSNFKYSNKIFDQKLIL